MFSRRALLKIAAALQFAPAVASAASRPAKTIAFGPEEPFSFEALKARAAALASRAYVAPPMPDPAIVKTMDYDAVKSIAPDPAYALYGHGGHPVTFLTVGQLAFKSVRLYALDDGKAREVLFQSHYFEVSPDSPFTKLPPTPAPFAGFEVRQAFDETAPHRRGNWLSFRGASYFRAVGEADQFGLSARGVAVNTAVETPEEFPDFTHFWIAEAGDDGDPVTIYALLDGPSLAGAYRFIVHRDRATTMDITCQLHLRRPMTRLGLAPLTSMFWFSETVKGAAADWRPEVHDSDGVAIWTGNGERIWRPLNNPATLTISVFEDENPRGFGLMQRDKAYDHYLDAVFYDRRPCGWVEPTGAWGKGAVHLVEIPTENETSDNIVAFWVPAEPTRAGQRLDYRYKLLWRDTDPALGHLALCVATRMGAGGIQGASRSTVLRKFVVEFKGQALGQLAEGDDPEAVLTTSRGRFSNVNTERSPDGTKDLWRAVFDLDPDGHDPVELRCFLRRDGRALTETWVFHYIPLAGPIK